MEYITKYPVDKIYIALYAEGENQTEETKAKIQNMREFIRNRRQSTYFSLTFIVIICLTNHNLICIFVEREFNNNRFI